MVLHKQPSSWPLESVPNAGITTISMMARTTATQKTLLNRYTQPSDLRMNNGPPQTAFLLASGKCPKRWHHHHLYDGKDDGHPKNAVKPLHAAYRSENE